MKTSMEFKSLALNLRSLLSLTTPHFFTKDLASVGLGIFENYLILLHNFRH